MARPITIGLLKKEGTPPWLYETLRQLVLSAKQNQTGLAAISRGEVPDGSGVPLTPDLSGYFLLAGRSGGQIGRGDTVASGLLQLSSTASTTKGKIHLGYPTPILTVDESGSLVGVNKSSPAAVLHLNALTIGVSAFPVSDSTGFPNSWTNQAGSTTAGVYVAAVSDDSDATYCTETIINNPGTELFFVLWNNGASPIVGTETFTLTFRHRRSAGQAGTERFKFVLTRAGFGTVATYTRSVQSSATYEDYAVTLTPTETTNLAGTGNVTVDIFAVGIGAASFDIAKVYYTYSSSTVSPVLRWDTVGVQSGQITAAGRMGVGTGSTSLAAEFTVVPDAIGTVAVSLQCGSSQTADMLDIVSSVSGAATFAVDNKAFLRASIKSTSFLVDSSDLTKKAAFDLTGITTATTRTFTLPNVSGTLVTKETATTISGRYTFTGNVEIDQAASAATPALKIVAEAVPTLGTYQFVITTSGGTPVVFYDVAAGDVFQAPNIVADQSFSVNNPGVGGGAGHQISSVASTLSSVTIPDISGASFLLTSGVQTASNKTLATTCVLISSTASAGVAFQDTTTSSKKLRMVLSGAVGNNNFVIATTAARTYTFRALSGGVVLDSGSALTSGRVPFATTGGALQDSSLFLFSTGSGLTLSALNLITDTTTGMKIGTATSQKLSFWNAAPIIQPTTGVAGATRTGGGGTTLTDTDTFDGYTVAQVVKALRNTGLLA